MPDIEPGDIVYKASGSVPMKVLEIDRGVAVVSFASLDGTQRRLVLPVAGLIRKKHTGGRAMFVVAKAKPPS